MMTPPKELAAQWFERVWNQKDASAIHDLLAPDGVGYTEGGVVNGPDQLEALMHRPMLTAFPDIRLSIDGIVAEGDEVVVRWNATATHSGPFADIPASGRKVNFTGMTWLRFRNGQIVEGSDRYNLHALISYLSSGQPSATVLSV